MRNDRHNRVNDPEQDTRLIHLSTRALARRQSECFILFTATQWPAKHFQIEYMYGMSLQKSLCNVNKSLR